LDSGLHRGLLPAGRKFPHEDEEAFKTGVVLVEVKSSIESEKGKGFGSPAFGSFYVVSPAFFG